MEFTRCLQCMRAIQHYPCPHCGYDLGRPPLDYELRPGTILNGKYVAGVSLGQGGFGITYVGWDLALDCKVAIKEYYPSGQAVRDNTISNQLRYFNTSQSEAARDSGKEMFLKEARKMFRARNIPQVVHVHDLFQENDTAYIVMDFVEGMTLKTLLQNNGLLSWQEAKGIFFPAMRTMEQVHKAGLVHRDLSPDNLMLLPDGTVQILDLGAAKDLNVNPGVSSMQVAKSGFSPLEQYSQQGSSGSWTDVYAMAATLYYSLTGVVPPQATDRLGDDSIQWNLAQLKVLPPTVLNAIKKAMEVLPKNRTQTMGEFLQGLDTPTPKPKPEPKPEAKPRKPSSEEIHAENAPVKSLVSIPLVLVVILILAIAGSCAFSLFRGMQKSYNSSQAAQQVQAEIATAPATTKAAEEVNVFPLPIQEQTIATDYAHTIAIKSDGTVVATGSNYYGECNVSGWTDIAAIAVGESHTVGLTTYGNVVATGRNDFGQCDVGSWRDITAISTSWHHTVGLRADGTVVSTYMPPGGFNFGQSDVENWTDIVAISTGDFHTVGLKADGTVVSTSISSENYNAGQCDVESWTDIVAISAGTFHTVGLKADGTVVAATAANVALEDLRFDPNAVDGWNDIVSICAGEDQTIGLKADGTMVAIGYNEQGQCNVSDWTDIHIPGTVESVPDDALTFQYTDEPVSFRLSNGKAVNGTIRKLGTPLLKCKEITTCVNINYLESGNVEGEWGLWLRQLSGEWILAGTFALEGRSAEAHLEFDQPISFDAWTCLCHCLGNSWNFNCQIWLQDASQFHYAWEK